MFYSFFYYLYLAFFVLLGAGVLTVLGLAIWYLIKKIKNM